MTEKGKSLLDRLGVKIGDKTSHSRTISEEDINTFAALSGDFNPVHVSEEYAKKTYFKGRIAHGTISIGLLSAAMAKLPGLPIFLGQDIKFLTITATAEVIEMRHDKAILTLKNTCTNQNGEVVIEGTASARLFPAP